MMFRHNAMKTLKHLPTLLLLGSILAAGCAAPGPTVLRLATTTSTYDSGLLQSLLPDFESTYEACVDILAVGTGQAIAIGERGDADVLLVHDEAKEIAFVAAGYGLSRHLVMYNDFVIVGAAEDAAGVASASLASEALASIAEAEAPFVSRGDDSGTHAREMILWAEAGVEPDPEAGWYFSIGQGMGEALQFANEMLAYTLADRGTFLALQDNLPDLSVLFGGESLAFNPDPLLKNVYHVMTVNPQLHADIEADLAQSFVTWLTTLETQQRIAEFGRDRFGEPLFFPDSEAWRAAAP
jgi:tungstate transport system substrate-binding protein